MLIGDHHTHVVYGCQLVSEEISRAALLALARRLRPTLHSALPVTLCKYRTPRARLLKMPSPQFWQTIFGGVATFTSVVIAATSAWVACPGALAAGS